MTIALLGVPTNSAGTRDGVARAPAALREAGLAERLAATGPFVDLGDVRVDEPSRTRGLHGIIDAENLAVTLSRIRAEVAAARQVGQVPIVVGGDCPVLIGALAGCADVLGTTPALVFVDGHEDAWPPHASTTGEAADMELGLLLGRSLDGIEPSLLAQIPRLDPSQVRVLGPRDRAEIQAAGVASLADDVLVLDDNWVWANPAEFGRQAATKLMRHSEAPGAGWWLHIDLDVLSSDALPAVDYQQPGGLSWKDLAALTDAAISVGGCVGATVTIYNPDLDPDRQYAPAIVAFISDLAENLGRTGVSG